MVELFNPTISLCERSHMKNTTQLVPEHKTQNSCVWFKLFITQHNLGAVNGSTEEGHRTSLLLHYPLRSDQPCAIYIQILPESPATKLPTTKQVQLRPPVAVTHNHSRMQNLTTPALRRG